MVYLSLALIFLGILIFLYSIILDSKKRRGDNARRAPAEMTRREDGERLSRKAAAAGNTRATGPAAPGAGIKRHAAPGGGPGAAAGDQAVLFEDSSRIIDYGSETGSIDASLQGYKKIKRIGSGKLMVEKGGITFFMDKKLYRYDFHRVRDLKPGSRHLALFLHGSKAVKLFIVEPESGIISAVNDAYHEYLRSSA